MRPKDEVLERDVGAIPPAPVTFDWIRGVFSDPASHDAEIGSALLESDLLAGELAAADLILIGTPIYNFGMPAQLKAWIDNVVRIGLTFTVSPEGVAAPIMEPSKRLILLTARGDRDREDADHGGPDLVIEGVRRPMAYIGIGRFDVVSIDGGLVRDDYLSRSFAAAYERIDALVEEIQSVL